MGLFKKKETTENRAAQVVQDKEQAKRCLFAADQYVKAGQFEKARLELEKAKKLDPGNIYIAAFRDRIVYFEQQKKKEATAIQEKAEAPAESAEPVVTQEEVGQNVVQEEPEVERESGHEVHSEEPAPAVEEPVTEEPAPEPAAVVEERSVPSQEVNKRKEEEEAQFARMKEELLKKVEEEMRKLEEERKLLETERKTAEEKMERLQREVQQQEQEKRKVQEYLQGEVQKLEAERRRAEEESRKKIDEELRRLQEEKDNEALRKLMDEQRALEEEVKRLQAERQQLSSKTTQKAEVELLQLKEEIQQKASEETIRKLEREFQTWQERERQRIDAEQQRLAAAKEKEEANARAIREAMERARELFALGQYQDAIAELSKVYALNPMLEEARLLEADVRKAEREESRRMVEKKLEEMRHRIEDLSRALELEKKAREEMGKHQVQRALSQLRAAFEKAWVNGAPAAADELELNKLAMSLAIPETVVQSIRREVKLDMYSKAVKEAIAKKNLMRNSSSTLEWLRKVYAITLDEYLEYESKFLTDLVAEKYQGTILFVSSDEVTTDQISVKLKSLGFAVVLAKTPEEALEKIEKIYPNFILCDMEFSKDSLTGIKFLHVLRSNSKFHYLPFILLCDAKRVPEIESSELKPNEGIVIKPVKFEELKEVMDVKLQAFKDYVSSLS